MASKNVTVNGVGVTEIVLCDLQSILRKSIGERVKVINYTSTSLLPKGENYGSSILKVDAEIKKTEGAPKEKLALVAKMMPPSEIQQNIFDLTASLVKETFVFEKLMDAYREVEKEAGVKPENLIDLLPKFYGLRLSLNEGSKVADKDAAMLLENLNARGYYTMNRFKGLDLNAAKLAISELARFHALGMAVKQKKPEFFAEARKYLDVMPFVSQDNDLSDVTGPMVKAICADPRIAKYEDRIKAAVLTQNWETFLKIEAVEPWVTIVHGDFWVNNMMFHQENGKIDDVKFIDFQISRATSPLTDLPYFLCGSTSMDVIDNHFDELINIYYENFIKVLKNVDCDPSPFSRDSFDKQLSKDGGEEFYRCLIVMKFLTFEMTEDLLSNDMTGNVLLSSGSDVYIERSWRIISKFIEKGWI